MHVIFDTDTLYSVRQLQVTHNKLKPNLSWLKL